MKLDKDKIKAIRNYILIMIIDIFIMIILNKMVNKESVVIYVAMRLVILFFSFSKRAFKICFQYFALVKDIFTKYDEDSSDLLDEDDSSPKNIFSLLILLAECALFFRVLQFTLTSFRNSLREIDIMSIIIVFTLIQLLVHTMNIYISKRHEGLQL